MKYDYIGALGFFLKIIFHIDLSQAKLYVLEIVYQLEVLAILKAPSSLGLKWESYFGFYHEDGFYVLNIMIICLLAVLLMLLLNLLTNFLLRENCQTIQIS